MQKHVICKQIKISQTSAGKNTCLLSLRSHAGMAIVKASEGSNSDVDAATCGAKISARCNPGSIRVASLNKITLPVLAATG